MRFAKLKIKPPPTKIPPIVYISVASILGTIAGILYSNTININFVTGISTSISICIFGCCAQTKQQQTILLLTGTFCLFFSRYIYVSNLTPPLWLVGNNGDFIELHGVVTSNSSTRMRTRGNLSRIDDRPPVTTFKFLASPNINQPNQHSQNLFTVKVDGVLTIHKGDKISTIGKLHRHSYAGNVTPTLYVSQGSLVKVTQKSKNVIFEIDQIVKQRILSGIDGEAKTLVSALFFGERESGWRKLSTIFRHGGLSHILAVSGLHIAIIMIAIFWVLRAASFGKTCSFVVICIVSLFLLSAIESRPPVLRAILMLIIASTLQFRGQRFGGLGILAIVAIVIVWIEPEVIKTAGFILSFTTVFGLCTLLPVLQWKLLGPRDNYAPILETTRYTLSSIWIVGLCALLSTAPLTIYLFGTLAPIGLISGIGGILFLVLILLLGLIRLIVGWVYLPIDDVFLGCLKITSTQMIEVAKMYGETPISFLYIKPPSILFTILLLTFISIVIMTMGRVKEKVIAGTILIVCMFFQPKESNTVITTLNVGHGTSHIIQDGEMVILVDAGSKANLDIGLDKIVPALQLRGIRKINKLIITHNDLDHCSAILDLMVEIEINEICLTPYALDHPTRVIKKIIQMALSKNVSISEIVAGWNVKLDHGLIAALWPDENVDYISSNEASIVLSIESNGRTVLLTGDINEETICMLLSKHINKVDVLEMPHHGQWSNESVSLLDKLQPAVVIQSTSKSRYANDRWIIPQNTDRLVTCVDGDITTTISDNGKIEIRTSFTDLNLIPRG